MVKNILVFGAGYVGSSLSVLLAEKYETILVDIDFDKVNKINSGVPPIEDTLMKNYLDTKNLKLFATTEGEGYINNSDLIILALPTNYDEINNYFDTSILEHVLNSINKKLFNGSIIIKSTIPIGFTASMRIKFPSLKILNIPEFLREGKAIEDNLNPSRIIVGTDLENSKEAVSVFTNIAINQPTILFMSSDEAEAVKLFANSYLATRISFFNELDSFALEKNLNPKNIIDGLSSDTRIGFGYNNPSFGYGGYCLPKDTKQLLANYDGIPQSIFHAIVESNSLRKSFIANKILELKPKVVGIYRLVMKKGSNNFRESAIIDIMNVLKERDTSVLVFEPLLKKESIGYDSCHDLDFFKKKCDVILVNRTDALLDDVSEKIFTRDIYHEN